MNSSFLVMWSFAYSTLRFSTSCTCHYGRHIRVKSDAKEQIDTCNHGNIFVILNFFNATEEKLLSADDILYVPVTCVRQLLGFFEMDPEHVPVSCVRQVVLTIVVSWKYGPRNWAAEGLAQDSETKENTSAKTVNYSFFFFRNGFRRC